MIFKICANLFNLQGFFPNDRSCAFENHAM